MKLQKHVIYVVGFLRIRYLDQFYSYHMSMTCLLLQANIRCENVLQMILISLFHLKTPEVLFSSLTNELCNLKVLLDSNY